MFLCFLSANTNLNPLSKYTNSIAESTSSFYSHFTNLFKCFDVESRHGRFCFQQTVRSGTCKYLALWHLPLCGKIRSNRTLAPGAGHVTQAKPIRAPGPLSHKLPSEPMRGQSSLTTTVRSRKHAVFLLKLPGSNTQT